MEAKIKKDLKVHLDKTAEMLRRDRENEWQLVNIPEISERELMSIVGKHGLENDEQTRAFCKFISIGTNFASLDFAHRIQTIPVLIKSVKELVGKIEAEIQEFADIANLFSSLIQSFVKLVINTKHNMRMALPHLEESVIHMTIMSEAMMPESDAPLDGQDLLDIDLALTNMSNGIVKLLEHAKSSKEESFQLDQRINGLKDDIESKITVTESRISFAKLMPKIGATAGLMTGATVATGAVESVAFGGAGALVLGGFTFPPLGAILLGAGAGAIGIGGLIMLIFKLWEKHQFKALAYLREILFNLNKLNNANLAFMDYMNRSEEDANKILTSMDFFVKNVKNGSHRYRRVNNDICLKAIDSTNDIIKCINSISSIKLAEWIDEDRPNYTLETSVPESIAL